MKALARLIGWILLLAGVVAIVGIVWGVLSDRLPDSFMAVLLMCAPVVLVLIIGRVLTRVGRRQESAPMNVEQWTRRGPV